MHTSTEKPALNTRLHSPGNTRVAVQTTSENDSTRLTSPCSEYDRFRYTGNAGLWSLVTDA